ncbi:unnamed protein product [Darwinula stevensoni]|uniref:UDP-N-acetylglucosamine--dolichyl-phosphate N-acetylglucosaminephosphotransferase n=1 Tax=Darwinula stevensoni TaxID=69355 RepID=A0A7R8XDS2_9CRUS|nr:unnamed protein product [Darwinula stevensoni]CAG0895070.1 unnamed protein product [Darwinula stevensoni]
MWDKIPIFVNVSLSVFGYFLTLSIIPKFRDSFLRAGIFGRDQCKKTDKKIPEAVGVLSACVFLVITFLFIPVPFGHYFFGSAAEFPYHEKVDAHLFIFVFVFSFQFVEYLAALLSICCMVLLGFADDVLNLKWRHKLLLPSLATLPLLCVYYVNFNSTTVIIPHPLRFSFGYSLDLGILYYFYMAVIVVFCTNAINILAGVNALEVGQSLVISMSIIIFNLIELSRDARQHFFSLYFMIPFFFTSLALFKLNW